MGARRHYPGAYDPAGPGAAAGILVVCSRDGTDRIWIVVSALLLVKGEAMKIFVFRMPRFLARILLRLQA